FDNTPQELQLRIFSEVFPKPWHHLDPSVSQSGDSPWLRALKTKLELPLICKSTWWAASKVLYEDIVIRRMDQIAPLAKTMSSDAYPTSQLRLMVNSLRMDTCVVWHEAFADCRTSLASILSRCSNLTSITHRSHPGFGFVPDTLVYAHAVTGDMFNPTWLVAPSCTGSDVILSIVASQLTRLDVHADLSNSVGVHDLHAVLKHAPCLHDAVIKQHHDFPTLILPSLLELRVDCSAMPFLPRFIINYWMLPSLQQLTIRIGANPMDPMEVVERFGVGLRFLQFFPSSGNASFTPEQQDRLTSTLESCCPRLEHLVLPALKPAAIAQHPIRSPSLKWLDIWIVHSTAFSYYPPLSWRTGLRRVVVSPTDSAVPALASVRLLDGSDEAYSSQPASSAKAGWPRRFHPRTLLELGREGKRRAQKAVTHRLPNCVLVQTEVALVRDNTATHFRLRVRDDLVTQAALDKIAYVSGIDWDYVDGVQLER
ncbi:uncharacterized protein BXZ73DRAFT_49694, partial [Epithele typhae]|uniref:uncharacterized protein n=1 Tax=Epithele typhae TaxID=378194 RepID=UPI002007C36D